MDGIYVQKNSYRIKIPYYDNGVRKFYSECFSFKRYGNKKNALDCAKRKRDEIRMLMNTGNFILPSQSHSIDTIEDVIDLKEQLLPRSEDTEHKHQLWAKKYMQTGKKFSDITGTDIQQCLNKMTRSCSQLTINRVLSLWRLCYKACIVNEMDIKDQTIKVVAPKSLCITKKRKVMTDYSSLDELLQDLFKSKVCSRDKQILSEALQVTYALGTRPAETYALKAEDIDTKNMCVSINKWMTSVGKLKTTKTEESYRYIPYTDKDKDLFEMLSQREGFLFERENGGLMCSNVACNIFYRVTNGRFRMYMLRHQLATDLVSGGADLKVTQKILGHKSAEMTLRYAEPREDTMREAIKLVRQ